MRLGRDIFVITLALAIGCGAPDDSDSETTSTDSYTNNSTTETDTDTETGSASMECADLSVAQCTSRSDCRTIDAREIHFQGGNHCVDWSQEPVAKGCISNDMGCGDAISYAAPVADPSDCWWFPSTCQPADWGACDPPVSAEDCDE